MRVGLIGAGRIGALHARLLRGLDDIDEVLIADVDASRAAALAADTGATPLPDPTSLIGAADGVVIAAATSAHGALIRESLAAGVPTYCEKPLGESLEDAIALAGEIEASGVPFQLGFQRRFDAGYREARRLVATGELGTVYAFRLAGHDPAPPHEAYIPTSGGLFNDFSVHDFDVIRWLLGREVAEVYSMGAVRGFPVFATYGDVDTAVATLRMDDGTLGVMTVARHDPLGYDIRAELFGSRDSVSVGLGPHTPMRSVEPGVPAPAGPAWPDFLVRFEDAYRDELAAFVSLAQGAIESPCTARDGVESLRVAAAANLSMAEHRPVRLDEIPGLPSTTA
jgi:myo-inositol 2-dehydrogenase/D-chiro-inositol 1-dehydrogenase